MIISKMVLDTRKKTFFLLFRFKTWNDYSTVIKSYPHQWCDITHVYFNWKSNWCARLMLWHTLVVWHFTAEKEWHSACFEANLSNKKKSCYGNDLFWLKFKLRVNFLSLAAKLDFGKNNADARSENSELYWPCTQLAEQRFSHVTKCKFWSIRILIN